MPLELSRRKFLRLMGAGAAALAVPGCGFLRRGTGEKPNIIFLLTDDQRWDAMGCTGNSVIKTPNMDRLAAKGVLFSNNFVTTSICAPSRASILTGQYQRRHGIDDFNKSFSPSAWAQTYPMLLRQAGYYTGFVGKYGMANQSPLPEEQFDFFWGFSGQGQYFHEISGEQVHLTRLIGQKGIEFLERRQQDLPFCLSVSFKAPHVQDRHPDQFLYDPDLGHLYNAVTIPVPETGAPHYFETLPEFIRTSEGRIRWQLRFASPEQYQNSVKGYYRLISGVDVAVGQIVTALEALGLSENTVIIVTSDNGFFLGEHGLAGKWLMYEESIRTPLIIYDPRLPGSLQGQRREEMTLNIDIAPTILDFAGVKVPESMQGKSLCPLILNASDNWRTDWFYEYHYGRGGTIPQSEGIRTERWKYIRYINQVPPYEQLFDLESDPKEINNLAQDQSCQPVLNKLRDRWQEMRRKTR